MADRVQEWRLHERKCVGCWPHWGWWMPGKAPKSKVKTVAVMLKAIHAQEDRQEALSKIKLVANKLRVMRLSKAAETVESGAHETLCYYHFPQEHWRRIRTNNPLERIMREIRRRTRVVGSFPDGESALMLSAARLRHIAGTKWSSKRYLNMDLLKELKQERMQNQQTKVG